MKQAGGQKKVGFHHTLGRGSIITDKMLKPRLVVYCVTVALIMLAPLLSVRPALAASATLYLSPASSSITNGSIFTVNVRENSGAEPVSAAEVHLTYPTDKLDFVSISSSSAFNIVAANSGGGGNVNIDRGATPAVTGDQLVASVRFKAKVSSGSATVSFGSSSKVVSLSEQDITAGKSSGTYAFKAPAPAAQADTVAPTISKAPEVTEVGLNSAVVTWSTNEPSTSEVVYGLNTGYGLAATDATMVTEHKVTLQSAILEPGTTYHYMVKSVDSAGNAVSSDDVTFSTKGYALDVTVVNQKNKPVKGAKVTVGEKSGTTNDKGKVALADLPLGTLAGTVEYQGKKTTVSVEMKAPEAEGQTQAASFKIETKANTWLMIGLIALGVLLLALAIWKIRKNRGSKPQPPASASTVGPVVTPSA
ncbi:hypothetical protein A3B63_00485 [Candidatus Saccharibacteria bacterium RIFCSPLOWO2_01_FULL_49_22]|nr:MAG: hypothetical protein A3B63_00485 [Candidatus Saccharibacteria bacterium RIFCSPLOWO2_01_FULL_49_22]